jgi:hypothetical protein
VLVTVGVNTVIFWRVPVVRTSNLAKKEVVLSKKGLSQTFLSAIFCLKDAVVGTASGDLYRFKGVGLSIVVVALTSVPRAPHRIVSGGEDGIVKHCCADLECLCEFGEFNAASGHPARSVFWDMERNTLVVGWSTDCLSIGQSVWCVFKWHHRRTHGESSGQQGAGAGSVAPTFCE